MSAATNPQDLAAMTARSPGRREYGIAIAVLVLSFAALALLGPFARLPLARVDAFIPAYESALAITDLITAAILFAHFTRARTLALLVLPCGYLFDALIIVPHALTFPGVFGPQGVLGGNSQTTAWLYCFWHGGFALYVIAYALIARRARARGVTFQYYRKALAVGVGATALLVVLLTMITIFAPEFLTPVIMDGDYSMLVTKGVSPAICFFSMIAVALLWSIRNDSTLNLWLLVVMCAWLCDVALSAVVGSNRFDLGWYGGRAFGLLAASFLLIVLLSELSELHEGLARGKLHRATALFEAVIKMTPDLVFVKDLQSKALLRNPAALFGKSWDDVVGRKEAEWHQNPQEAEEVVANDRMVIETGKSMQFVERFTTEQGVRTLLSTKSPLFDEQGEIVGTIGVSTDITEREIRAKHTEFIMHELSHRSKNILTIVQAIAHQSIRRSSSLEEFSQHFNERLASLSRLHDLLIQEEWRGVSLRTIAETQVGPFAGGRMGADGPEVRLKPNSSQVISMVLHELATNATKYGALSASTGTVLVTWGFVDERRKRLFLQWQEVGGPPVMKPSRKGFGTVVLERMVHQISDASASLEFPPSGVMWYLEAPVEALTEEYGLISVENDLGAL